MMEGFSVNKVYEILILSRNEVRRGFLVRVLVRLA